MTIDLKCQFCGTDFQASSLKKIYCSATCRNYASLERSGTLPAKQQDFRDKIAAIGSLPGQLKSNPKRPVSVLKGFLQSHFHHYNETGGELRLEKHVLDPEEEVFYELDRVEVTTNGDFILNSIYEGDIDKVAEIFLDKGHRLNKFTGVTKIKETDWGSGRHRTFRLFIPYEIALDSFKKEVPDTRVLYVTE